MRKQPLKIGEVIKEGNHCWTVFDTRNIPTAYASDKQGLPIKAEHYIRAFHDYVRVSRNQGFIYLSTVSRSINGVTYAYIKIAHKKYNIMASLHDKRYRAFMENAPKATIAEFKELENNNDHVEGATLVVDFFNHPHNYNPALKVTSKLTYVNHVQP